MREGGGDWMSKMVLTWKKASCVTSATSHRYMSRYAFNAYTYVMDLRGYDLLELELSQQDAPVSGQQSSFLPSPPESHNAGSTCMRNKLLQVLINHDYSGPPVQHAADHCQAQKRLERQGGGLEGGKLFP
jgi:hypothetical protein